MTLLPRMVGGHHVFAAVFDPFDRAAEAQRRESMPEIKDRGQPTRSSAGRLIG
jgi:hypothetical protein